MTVSILNALDDPHLFGPFFRGHSWNAWRSFLCALFALPLDEEALATYRAHTGRAAPPVAPFSEAALIIGRRGGKSRMLALIAVYLACFRDYDQFLAPGEVATVAVIAADRKQARTIFRYALGLLRAIPMLADLVQDESSEAITLSNRVCIEIATASFRVTRGYTFAAVLADETAFWRSDDSANPDVEIFRALRPGLSSVPGALLLNASSPYRKGGVLYSAFRRHYGRDDARVLVWQAPTLAMNPSLDPAIVAEAYDDDPAAAAAEYGAEFRDDIADFVSREIVESCIVPGRTELAPVSGVTYFGFVDPSGGSADSMTLGIAHAHNGITTLDLAREIRPPFSPEAVVTDFADTLRQYGLATVQGDRYAGEWPRERFREHGIDYQCSEKPKSQIYGDFLPVLNSGRVELLDLPRLTSQLCGLERRTARSGRDSIDHAPGAHDDVANAAAGALLRASGRGNYDWTVASLAGLEALIGF